MENQNRIKEREDWLKQYHVKTIEIDVKGITQELEKELNELKCTNMIRSNQLKELGIPKECYRIYDRVIDSLLPYSLSNATLDGKYNIGYVTGVFDLFHIGHLNILKQCKNRCHYLIVGVVNDNLVELEKGKCPFIPLKERMEIVGQCKYVDKVVEIDEHNTNKLDAWKELRYGCLFAGSDHEVQHDWLNLQRQLRSLGANLEFFPYTEGTSSTILQKIIKNEVEKQ